MAGSLSVPQTYAFLVGFILETELSLIATIDSIC